MISHVKAAWYIRDYVLHLSFDDGAEGDVDLAAELYGQVFEPLKEPARFREFTVHPELGTLVWPNGADFAPEFLRESLRVDVRAAS